MLAIIQASSQMSTTHALDKLYRPNFTITNITYVQSSSPCIIVDFKTNFSFKDIGMGDGNVVAGKINEEYEKLAEIVMGERGFVRYSEGSKIWVEKSKE